jgi:hypothetical protein
MHKVDGIFSNSKERTTKANNLPNDSISSDISSSISTRDVSSFSVMGRYTDRDRGKYLLAEISIPEFAYLLHHSLVKRIKSRWKRVQFARSSIVGSSRGFDRLKPPRGKCHSHLRQMFEHGVSRFVVVLLSLRQLKHFMLDEIC